MSYRSSSWFFVNHVIYTICYTGVYPGFLSIMWYIQYVIPEFILVFCQSCDIYNMLYRSSSWLFVNHVIYTICYTGVHPGFLSIMWYIQYTIPEFTWLFVNHVIYTICYTGLHPSFLWCLYCSRYSFILYEVLWITVFCFFVIAVSVLYGFWLYLWLRQTFIVAIKRCTTTPKRIRKTCVWCTQISCLKYLLFI
jgi:hypothetical protein